METETEVVAASGMTDEELIFAWRDMTGEAIEGAARAEADHVEVDDSLLSRLEHASQDAPPVARRSPFTMNSDSNEFDPAIE